MPRNFFDEGCCDCDVLNSPIVTGCLSFSATGSLRLPNRTDFPAGTCGGAGAIRHDTALNAIVYRFGGPVTGPVLQIPPAAGTPAPVPVQASDDGASPPTISPLGTLSTQPFGDMSDARWVVGLPNGALSPSLANSVFHFEPGIGALLDTTLTVKPLSGGVASTTVIFDMPNALATTTLDVRNSLAGIAALTVDSLIRLTSAAGVAVLDTVAGDLTIAPAGLDTNVTGNLTATLDITGTTINGGTVGQRVILRTAGGVPEIGTSVGGGNLSINPDSGITTFGTVLTVNDITNIVTISPTLTVTTITTPLATDLVLTPLGNDLTITDANVNPTTNGTRDLGTASLRWNKLFLATGIEGTSSLSINMVANAATTTLTIENTGTGASRAQLDVDARIRFQVGSGGAIGILDNVGGVPAFLSSSAFVGMASNSGAGGSIAIFLDQLNVNVAAVAGLVAIAVTPSTGDVMQVSGNGVLRTDGTNYLVETTGGGAPAGGVPALPADRTIRLYRDTNLGGLTYLVFQDGAGATHFVAGTGY